MESKFNWADDVDEAFPLKFHCRGRSKSLENFRSEVTTLVGVVGTNVMLGK